MRVTQALCLLSIIGDEEVRQIVQIRFIYSDWVRWLLEEKTGHYGRLRKYGESHSASSARFRPVEADWPKSVQCSQ